MTDKQIIENRPICLYQDTCLFLKEKTRLCKDCIHHKEYWREVVEKEQVEKIKRLAQECERLKEQLSDMISQSALLPRFFGLTADEITNTLNQLDQLKSENKHLNDLLNQALKELEKTRETLTEIKEIAEELLQTKIPFLEKNAVHL